MFNNKTILITGGTGSFGKKMIKRLLKDFKPKKIIIYSRDELKQYNLQSELINFKKQLRFFIGDVRDLPRLKKSLEKVNYVIHAAALKHVPVAEYNPFEAVKTNIIGTQNIVEASLAMGVEKVIALSTDKASSPVNLYGATKLCSDKLFSSANNIIGNEQKIFTVVRYGNVMASRGSIIPEFFKQKKNGYFTITDKNMTRFNITLAQAIKFVIQCINKMKGGEIFVPKIPSYKILDLVKAVNDKKTIKYIGLRPGEKIHEEMISTTDAINSKEFKDYFIIYPSYTKINNKKKISNYSSYKNKHFLSIKEIRRLIKNNYYSFELEKK